jgi:transcriptional regulator with XRE-family HTH domain
MSKDLARLKMRLEAIRTEKQLAIIVARNIKIKRQELGITQKELAWWMDRKQPQIARWERSSYGRHTIHSLNQLAVTLGTTVTDLVATDPEASDV